jgi:hypothetical protein
MWLMTLITIGVLYFDGLRKLIILLERFAEYKLPNYVKTSQYFIRKRLGK